MKQDKLVKPLILAVGLPLLYLVDISPQSPLGLTLVREAHAIVGAPLTPVSVAGVARRSTYRAVAYGSTATATTSATAQQQAATAQQQSATAQQQSATAQQQSATAQKQAAAAAQAPAGTLAVGSIVSTLPAGCAPETRGGVEYQRCGTTYYRAAFQGNNLVYVVQQP
jgi:hypothetical protein